MNNKDRFLAQYDRDFYSILGSLSAWAIIFVLVTIAFGYYVVMIEKARLTNFQLFFYELRTEYQIFYALHGRLPKVEEGGELLNNASLGNYLSENQLQAADYTPDTGFYFTLSSPNEELDGKVLQYSPVHIDEGGSVIWLCGNSELSGPFPAPSKVNTIAKKYLPASCKNH